MNHKLSISLPYPKSLCVLLLLGASVLACSIENQNRSEPDQAGEIPSQGGDKAETLTSMSGNEGGEQEELQGATEGGTEEIPRTGIGVLGYNQHRITAVDLKVIGTAADGLNRPTGIQINPVRPDELWVVNHQDDTFVVFFEVQSEQVRSHQFFDPYAVHFLSSPTSISFDLNGQFATCQDSDNGGDYFMGPTLWTSDFNIFARSNPDAVAYLGGDDLGSHLDMLHESPHCMGIAWETENVYWVFEGETSSIARVDFGQDHGPGFDDHSDGFIVRYAQGDVSRFPTYPSHLVFDQRTQNLYVADTGNHRIGVLDTLQEGSAMIRLPVIEEGTTLLLVDEGPSVETLCPELSLRAPTGLTLYEELLYVADTSSGRISAIQPETCEVIDWLDTGISSPGLMGIAFDEEGTLYAVDSVGNRVLRITAQP